MTPHRAPPDFDNWPGLLRLILDAFAYMDGVIDPPSSAHALTPQALKTRAKAEYLYITDPLVACAFFRADPDALYIGKLAVAPRAQRQGQARALVACAQTLATHLGLPRLRLETRIELSANHATFAALGFARTAEKSHPGFTRPTSVTMEKPLCAP